jgi:hypothetical protein
MHTFLFCAVEKAVRIVPHSPESPYLASADFWLFPELKKDFRGRLFSSAETCIKVMEAKLKVLIKNGLDHMFKSWVR